MIAEKNRLKVLDKGDIDAIHGATIEVLGKVGIRLESDDALDLL
jgi:trimethylamine:corrinoid methyltransferase-like protein